MRQPKKRTTNTVRALSLAAIAALTLAGCTEEPPLYPKIQQFKSNQAAYSELKALVLAERGLLASLEQKGCMGIGRRMIGRYWQTDTGWVEEMTEQPVLTLGHVLQHYDIQQASYERYKELLAKLDVESVEFCRLQDTEWVRIIDWGAPWFYLVECMAIYSWSERPEDELKALGLAVITNKSVALDDGWYVEQGCD